MTPRTVNHGRGQVCRHPHHCHSRAGGNPPGPEHILGLLERYRQSVDPGGTYAACPGDVARPWIPGCRPG